MRQEQFDLWTTGQERVPIQRPGDHQALLHPLGIVRHPVFPVVRQADSLQQACRIKVSYPEKRREKFEVGDSRHILVKALFLEAGPDMRLNLRSALDYVLAENGDSLISATDF